MSNFYKDDIVVVLTGPARGAVGIVQGEGNVWDYTVRYSTGDVPTTGRFDPEQLKKISLNSLLVLAAPVSPLALAVLGDLD